MRDFDPFWTESRGKHLEAQGQEMFLRLHLRDRDRLIRLNDAGVGTSDSWISIIPVSSCSMFAVHAGFVNTRLILSTESLLRSYRWQYLIDYYR